jgi:Domain of unknown function (DUF4123)
MNAASYILLDAARMAEEFDETDKFNSKNLCLLNARGEECLKSVSPYLFSIDKNSDFQKWIVNRGLGLSWGILVESKLSMEDLHRHFRKLLLMGAESKEGAYFRFFDPRVLRLYLPACDLEKLNGFFGPVQKFICEDEDSSFALLFSFNGKQLIKERMAVKQVL